MPGHLYFEQYIYLQNVVRWFPKHLKDANIAVRPIAIPLIRVRAVNFSKLTYINEQLRVQTCISERNLVFDSTLLSFGFNSAVDSYGNGYDVDLFRNRPFAL